jgi:hypothetical protein
MMTVFFSLDLNGKRAKASSYRLVRTRLENFGIVNSLVIGCYKGDPETTVKALVTTHAQLAFIKAIAGMYQQEAILQVIEESDEALLVDVKTDTIVHVGQFSEITPKDAGLSKNWTYLPKENKYYACI